MDEVRAMSKIEVDLSQKKIDFINDVYQKELQHGKKVALESVLTENEAKELIDSALWRVCMMCGVDGGEHWWSDFLFGVILFGKQWRAENSYSRYSK